MKSLHLEPDEIIWPLGHHDPIPEFQVPSGSFGRMIKVDPYPAYHPDRALVDNLLAECVERFPLAGAGAALLVTLPHDFADHLNGITFEDMLYRDASGNGLIEETVTLIDGSTAKLYPSSHTIVLSGKRIPIHPAMLRYLVAHEYGHAAFNHAARKLGYRTHEHEKLEDAYLVARGAPPRTEKRYRGGKWHVTPAEVIANDFRILIMGQESEFWPHPHLAHPSSDVSGAILEWWEKAFAAAGVPFTFADPR